MLNPLLKKYTKYFSASPNKYHALLIIIIFLVTLNNLIWLKNNKLPPTGNGLQDLFPGINFFLDVVHNQVTFQELLSNAINPFTHRTNYEPHFNYFQYVFYIYPPLVPLSYSFFYFLFGPNTRMELMVNVLFLAIALFSIYGIGKKIFNGKAGLLAAFIFSSFPGIISLSRAVYAEFNLMCMITLTLFLLLQTDFFRNRKYSILFGISLGLTALTKWEFPITMIGPFLLCLSQTPLFVVNEAKTTVPNSYIRINFLLSILISILISFSWYSVSVQDIIWHLFIGSGKILPKNYSGVSLSSVLIEKFSYFPLVIINTSVSLFYFLLLIIGGISFIYLVIKNRNQLSKIRSKLFYGLFLVLWIAIPYLVLSVILDTPLDIMPAPSHIMSVLPAIAILISLGVFSFKSTIVRSIFIFLIILYGLGSYLHSFVNFGKLDLLYKLKLYLSRDAKLTLITDTDNISRDEWERKFFILPDTRDWKIKEILSFIKEDSRNMKSHPVILILKTKDELDCFGFQYYNLLGNYELFIEPRGNDRSESPPDPSKFDYVVINPRVDDIMDETVLSETIKLTPNIEKVHKIDELKKTFFNKYKLIKEYVLPDNTIAKVYKLTNS